MTPAPIELVHVEGVSRVFGHGEYAVHAVREVSHDAALIDLADRVLLLRDGRLVDRL
jgi:hypothetical protein